MKKLILAFVVIMACSFSMNAANYTINDESIDNLFAEATMVEAPAAAASAATAAAVSESNNKTIVALVLDTVGLGYFGVHRMILGSTNLMWLWYTLTVGGIFGIVPLIDWVMLLIDVVNNQNSYIGNTNFIMWT